MERLDFYFLRDRNVARCGQAFHPLDSWSPTDWATALGGECGEALNVVKKIRRLDGSNPNVNRDGELADLIPLLGDELADIVIYADLLAARMDIDLGAAVRRKFNATSDRVKSPIKL